MDDNASHKPVEIGAVIELISPDCERFEELKCPAHPDRRAEFVCSNCSGIFCVSCILPLGRSFCCHECASRRLRSGRGRRAMASALSALGRPWGIAATLLVALCAVLAMSDLGPDPAASAEEGEVEDEQQADAGQGRDLTRWLAKALRLKTRTDELERRSMHDESRQLCRRTISAYERILKEFPGIDCRGRVLLAMGAVHERLGEVDRAVDLYRQSINEPTTAEYVGYARCLCGSALLALGRMKEAKPELEKGIEGLKELASQRSTKALSSTQIAWSREKLIARATGTDVTVSEIALQAWFRLAEACEAVGDIEAACRHLETLISTYGISPYSESVWVAQARTKLGKLRGAASEAGDSADPDRIEVKPLED
ncbi:MAG: tetratricopeptide repeat protein [Planctomycetota bacterium]|nr:tetratricopeptide repeat protein [Planctomycetota bacterium]